MVSRSFSMCSEDSNPFSATGTGTETGSDSEDGDDSLASLYSMFSSMEKVTIESLKAKLSSLPEGQTDLGALLVAAKVDLTVEDIVGPPLTQVKKIMEAKGLSEWQMTLCLKIRRRKKNTAAVRSSRRKRNQYVVDLRDTVYELKRRRHEAKTQNELLKQLSALWERLCSEVESEIQDGVRQQLNFNIPSFEESMTNNRRISAAENQEINTKLNSIRTRQDTNDTNNTNIGTNGTNILCTKADNPISVDADIMANLLLTNSTDGVLHFETNDRGAMEL